MNAVTVKLPRGVRFIGWDGRYARFRIEVWRVRWETIRGIPKGLTPPYPNWDDVAQDRIMDELRRRTGVPLKRDPR